MVRGFSGHIMDCAYFLELAGLRDLWKGLLKAELKLQFRWGTFFPEHIVCTAERLQVTW